MKATGARGRAIGWIAVLMVLDALFVLAAWGLHKWQGQETSALELAIHALQGLLVVFFLLLARKEILFLVSRPTKLLGTGLSRVWAVARTTILEAWAGRIWLLPLIWLGCALILIFALVPFDESERIPLYIRTLLTSQQVLVLVMLWVMACVSLPREREKKTLISTSSKPLSRLEILLGKFTGLTAATGLMLGVMFITSLLILLVSDYRLRGRAREAYGIQKNDFAKTMVTPSEELNQLAERGSLFAYNYITVPPEGMSILGSFSLNPQTGQPQREILGGTSEKISYRFTPYLPALPDVYIASPGARPFFEFQFPVDPRSPTTSGIQLSISAYCSTSHRVPPPTPQEAVITLDSHGVGHWEPDNPGDLFTPITPSGDPVAGNNLGEVTLDVTCRTPDVYLLVLDGADPDPKTGSIPSGASFNTFYYPSRNAEFPMVPRANPLIRGYERRERQEVSGPKGNAHTIEYAIYRFPGSTLRNIPIDDKGNFKITAVLETYKSSNPNEPTHANIDVFSADASAGDPVQFQDQEVLEKRPMEFDVPQRLLGDPDPAKRGDLFIRVYSVTPDQSISVIENSIRIELRQTPFALNLFKSELVILVEAMLLIAVCLACSVRLGWPVAMFLSAICVAFGLLIDFIASLPDYGGLGALNYRGGASSDTLFRFFDSAASMLWHVLGFVSSFVPNFTLFDPQEYIGTLRNTPWSVVNGDILSAGSYAFLALTVAYLLFRKQELG
jgi:hypothetical protein